MNEKNEKRAKVYKAFDVKRGGFGRPKIERKKAAEGFFDVDKCGNWLSGEPKKANRENCSPYVPQFKFAV